VGGDMAMPQRGEQVTPAAFGAGSPGWTFPTVLHSQTVWHGPV